MIPLSWHCDNIKECANGLDEFNCHYMHSCFDDEFLCRSGGCLPESVKCNGEPNCSDGSDERSCHTMDDLIIPTVEEFERALDHLNEQFKTKTELPTTTKPEKDFAYITSEEATKQITVRQSNTTDEKIDIMHIQIAELEAQNSVIYWMLIILVVFQLLFLLSLVVFCFWPTFFNRVNRLCALNIYKTNETTINPQNQCF
ncbi:hypothetical protein M3Y97_00821600 [Aphelenchoides bicaudatus]|nr:hypothetical protein M3Y97_00821600 [Aphelenchoides bicaudatus]